KARTWSTWLDSSGSASTASTIRALCEIPFLRASRLILLSVSDGTMICLRTSMSCIVHRSVCNRITVRDCLRMIVFWRDHLGYSRDRPAFNWPSLALLEHDLRNDRDHLNDLRRELQSVGFNFRPHRTPATTL